MLTKRDTMLLAAAAIADPRTVARWGRGETVKIGVRERIEHAARELGIDRPATTTTTEA